MPDITQLGASSLAIDIELVNIERFAQQLHINPSYADSVKLKASLVGSPEPNAPYFLTLDIKTDALKAALDEFRFDFGDGAGLTTELAYVDHVYTAVGEYSVTLTVVSGDDEASGATQVTVRNGSRGRRDRQLSGWNDRISLSTG